jgi:DNA invertase Pin-like site-specific DNA recombinase
MRRNVSQVLVEATQKKLGEWSDKIKNVVEVKEQELMTYEQKKQELVPKLLEAHEKGIPIRELARITGISHATLARWVKEAVEKKAQKHEQGKTQEGQTER